MEFNELFRKYLDDDSFKQEYLKLSNEEDYKEFAKKYDIPYTLDEMKTLVQEKAESANCGSGGEHEKSISRCNFSGHVGQYSVQNGTYYYFTEDGKDHWYYGRNVFTSVDEYVDMFGNVVKKETIHHVDVEKEDNIELRPLGKEFQAELKGADWTAYTTMTIS